MRIVSTVVLLAVAGAVAYLLYWQHRLGSVLDQEGVSLQPVRLQPAVGGAVRRIELGFATFDVPASLRGDPVEVGNSLFVSLRGTTDDPPPVIVCPPLADSDPEIEPLLEQYARLTGGPRPTYWELRKRALLATPFSVWSVPRWGNRRTSAELTLLSLKAAQVHTFDAVEFYENDRLGVTVGTRPDYVFVQVTDKHAGASQLFMLMHHAVDPHAFVSALVGSYRLTVTDFGEPQLKERLRAAGIPRQMNASARGGLTNAARLQRIVDELQAWRAESPPPR